MGRYSLDFTRSIVAIMRSARVTDSASIDKRPDRLPQSKEIEVEFNFLSAECVRNWNGKTMPTYRDLLRLHPETIERKKVTLSDVLSGSLVEKYGTVSHRWMEPGVPDSDGVQLSAVKELLDEHPCIEYVWFDD